MLAEDMIRDMFERKGTIAIVGLSDQPSRASHSVASFLQRAGHRIIPVNPTLSGPVLGEQPYARLRDVDVPVDIVDIFRRPEYVPGIVEDAIAIGAQVIWMQLGIMNQAAAARAEAAGLDVVMNRCTAVEYGRVMS